MKTTIDYCPKGNLLSLQVWRWGCFGKKEPRWYLDQNHLYGTSPEEQNKLHKAADYWNGICVA